MTLVACHLCGRPDLETVEAAAAPYRVVRCPACDLRFVTPQPAAGELERAYGEAYYTPWRGPEARRRRALWRRRLRIVRGAGGRGPLLDVGCGDGGFLAVAREAGFEVQGTEFSPYAAAFVRRTHGIEVRQGELQATGLPADAFATVTLWHSLEHARDPLGVLRAVHRVLRPGGLAVVAVPNADDRVFRWLYRIVRGRPPHLFSPGDRELHLFHFSAPSLERILTRAGFHRIRIGPDLGQVEPAKRIADLAAALVSGLVRRRWWGALLALAEKPA